MKGLLEKFGLKKSHILEIFAPVKMEDVKVGQIYEFTNGYHTKTPYYAEVIDVGHNGVEDYFKTSIPGYHELEIVKSNNFDYHSKRMRLMGNKTEFGHLLLSQKNLVTHTRR